MQIPTSSRAGASLVVMAWTSFLALSTRHRAGDRRQAAWDFGKDLLQAILLAAGDSALHAGDWAC